MPWPSLGVAFMPLEHNRLLAAPTFAEHAAEAVGTICVLLCDGRLFGPFASTFDARYWCVSQDLKAFSTYDLLAPRDAREGG